MDYHGRAHDEFHEQWLETPQQEAIYLGRSLGQKTYDFGPRWPETITHAQYLQNIGQQLEYKTQTLNRFVCRTFSRLF
ncbi:predicted protein [Sclerotinia sclerotiorum 1980 UF-70]|uniref:Uncharacterized protein n=2 Tax=Sclerotinia sclerotiorum (strain ATCC 18683 / 1980 / Ss-1) TaxID=665079 RepID=A7EZF9_SCLS1|nr:predicted protein [Sclerotinia sclerotiorum 1980 UF-70]APA12265.1 hypothetical protein sscle_09g070350 [Sclerotinia sclerotiorum 1980 UF-70]EDN94851.1 predicted protein [Sclerotinia sclerotiorum 1980 UF-70]